MCPQDRTAAAFLTWCRCFKHLHWWGGPIGRKKAAVIACSDVASKYPGKGGESVEVARTHAIGTARATNERAAHMTATHEQQGAAAAVEEVWRRRSGGGRLNIVGRTLNATVGSDAVDVATVTVIAIIGRAAQPRLLPQIVPHIALIINQMSGKR